MPVPSKKRRRPSGAGAHPAPSKRKPPQPEEDEDILSDEVDSMPGSPAPHAGPGGPDEDEDDDDAIVLEPEPENETAEQKRLRLARNYLRSMGISEDASDDDKHADDDDDDDASDASDDDDEEGPNDLLRRHALVDRGRAVLELADRFAATTRRAVVSRGTRAHALPPTSVALARDDERVAVSGGKDSRVVLWDVETGVRTHVFKPTLERETGERAGSRAGKVRRPEPADADGHLGPVLAVALSDDGALAVSGGRDGLLRVWDARAGKVARWLRGHRGEVTALAFRQGTRQLFSGGEDRCVKVWDMDEMAYAETLFGHGGAVGALDSLANERALSAGRDGTLRLYKLAEESQLVYRRADTMSIDAVAMMTEQRFLSGGDDGAFCLWQMNKRKAVAVAKHAHGDGLGCEAWVSAVAAFRNTDLALSGGGDGCVRMWRCEKVPKMIGVGKVELGRGFVNGISVGSSNRVMVAGVGREHRLGRWSKASGAKNGIHFVRVPEFE